MMKRRDFLKLCLASGLSRSLPFVASCPTELNQHFSIIHLKGGNDAYNTVIPVQMDTYYKERPNLALGAETLLNLNQRYGLNSTLKNLYGRFKQGQVAIYLGIGYQNMSYSHVRAEQIWHTGDSSKLEGDFWAQRFLDQSNLKVKLKPVTVLDLDTHFDQKIRHKRALLSLDQKIGHLSKGSICFVYSEMGRSLKENDEGGTDHGHSNVAFLIGEKVRGGIYGEYKAAEGDFAIDFKDVYTEIENLGIGRTV